jgi:catechol 2,3-dioxygenase-like lactoylglutathione lyase family enzyme
MLRRFWLPVFTSIVVLSACGKSQEGSPSAPAQPVAPAASAATGGTMQPSAAGASGSAGSASAGAGGMMGMSVSGVSATGGMAGEAPTAAAGESGAAGSSGDGAPAAAGAPGSVAMRECEPRTVMPSDAIHFHHVHFNTTDPEADLAYYEKLFGSTVTPFCMDKSGEVVSKANKTERAWFLYTKVAEKPDMALNTYMEHIGWMNQDIEGELKRIVELDAPRYPVGRAQCDTAFEGTMACLSYYFYLLAPSGARVEVALGPGPATAGFGHVHFIMGEDFTFFEKLTNGAYNATSQSIDDVNHIDALLVTSMLDGEMVVDSKGKPIDHLAYSTSNLEAERDRVAAAGITIAEDISFKAEYGFRSFFVKTATGTWLEMVEDSPFQQQ